MEARKDLLDVILGKMTVRPGASLTCSSSGKQQQQYQHQQLEEQDRVENQSKKSKTWRRDPPRGLTGATGRVDWRACFGRNARQSPIARETHTHTTQRTEYEYKGQDSYVQPSKHSRAGGQADGRHGEGRTCTCACASTDGHALRDSYEHVLVRACSAVRAAAGAVRVLARETFWIDGHSVDRGAGGSGGDAMTFGGEGVWPGQGEASCAVCLNLGGRAGRRVCCVRWRRGASARQQNLG